MAGLGQLWQTFQQGLGQFDPRAMAQGLGTAPSEGAAQFGSNFAPGIGDVSGLVQDLSMYATDPESRKMLNYGLTGLGLLPFVPALASLGRATRNVPTGLGNEAGMITFHGSPHRINNVTPDAPLGRFDMSKVGTGEGNQAYGHGIYLAEKPETANTYRTAGAVAYANNQVQELANRAFDVSGGDRGKALEWLHKRAMELPNDQQALRQTYFDALNNYDSVRTTGHLYTVDLPDEHIAKMLDWDAPLSEQPEAVHEIVRDMLKQQGYLRQNDNGPRQLQSAFKAWKMEHAGMAESGKGESIYGLLEKQLGSQEAASKYLNERGIPGIKYFDGGSRAAGSGTRNFVIFDPDIAKILKRE